MAIVRSQDGHFFEVPDDVLKQHEIKAEDAPQGAQSGPGPQLSGGSGNFGPSGGVSPVQIIVNYVQGGGGGGGQMQGPPAGEKSKEGAPANAAQDVGGRYCGWHNCWRNCWKNCWRNYCRY